jgi:hypothetical protein
MTKYWNRNKLVKISQAELDILIDLTNDTHKYKVCNNKGKEL